MSLIINLDEEKFIRFDDEPNIVIVEKDITHDDFQLYAMNPSFCYPKVKENSVLLGKYSSLKKAYIVRNQIEFEYRASVCKKIAEFQMPADEEIYRRIKQVKIEVPLNIGDTIYVVPSKVNYQLNIINGYEENNRIYPQVIDHIAIYRGGYYLSTCDGSSGVIEQSYSENWFLTEEEAQRRLEQLDKICSSSSWTYRKMKGKIKNE